MLAPITENSRMARNRHVDPISPKVNIGIAQVTKKVDRARFLVFLA